ncbi:TusE/DsrC/DsvC family sulfur relay protein [Sinisalibacter aestuarii]|uniref:Sulfurtransferase TusE n=1 Tax=Sinisalibacter aestuarii TaxID=2949426 RepID=A0ABQ5LTV7_9RHOB|nr:TusE/DsrC/DsvC family sulfur relay protein [Sinisalibacter aestuarii]GKY88414.1 sulfurtransferase TusE [Sinisalibacter aestuarii]
MRAVAETPVTLTLLTGESFTVDGHGYLADPEAWTESFADYVAREEGIELSPRHWALIRWIREQEADHGVMPDARFAMKYLGGARGKQAGREELFALFPYGYVKQAIRIAGMRQPRAWSTG